MYEGHKVEMYADDKDLTSQYGIVFGEFQGGDLVTINPDKSEGYRFPNASRVVFKMAGRYPHMAEAVETGTRFSVYFFKIFDERIKKSEPRMWPPQVMHSEYQEQNETIKFQAEAQTNKVTAKKKITTATNEARKKKKPTPKNKLVTAKKKVSVPNVATFIRRTRSRSKK